MQRVDTPSTLVFHLRNGKRSRDLNRNAERYVDLKLLIEANSTVEKVVVIPEVARSHGFVDGPAQVRLQHVTDAKRLHRDVFLTLVRVHRRLATDSGVQFLNFIGRGIDNASVRFSNPRVDNVEGFKTRHKGINEQAKFMYGGFRLDTDSNGHLTLTFTVRFKTNGVAELLDHVRLIRKVGLLRLGRQRRLSASQRNAEG